MFIQPGEICAVYLHIDRIDFRKGINGLGCEVTLSFGDSLLSHCKKRELTVWFYWRTLPKSMQ